MILVTGGTGLVGAHLLYKLVSENEKVKEWWYHLQNEHDTDMNLCSNPTWNHL